MKILVRKKNFLVAKMLLIDYVARSLLHKLSTLSKNKETIYSNKNEHKKELRCDGE